MATVSEICGPPWRRARPNQQEREKDTTTLPNKIVRTQAYRKAIELVHAQIIHTSRTQRYHSAREINQLLMDTPASAQYQKDDTLVIANVRPSDKKTDSTMYISKRSCEPSNSGHRTESGTTSDEVKQSRRHWPQPNTAPAPKADASVEHISNRQKKESATSGKPLKGTQRQAAGLPSSMPAVPPIPVHFSTCTAKSQGKQHLYAKNATAYSGSSNDNEVKQAYPVASSKYMQPSPRSLSSFQDDSEELLPDVEKKKITPVSPFHAHGAELEQQENISNAVKSTYRRPSLRKASIEAVMHLSPLDPNVQCNVFEVDLSNCNLEEEWN